ncbi:MAG: endopeptidase La [Oribacterium sp.]|jgi:ATP-dependent Lon protease|nr:endopeptidase La [Oribacterium sp.]MDY6308529.1 endopeptidase La [Oribacterium sp.]MDY6317730.1 endopeptidase La [Oribacterium sp.]
MKVLPLYNVLVLPHSNIYFQGQTFQALTNGGVYEKDNLTILVLKKEQSRAEMDENSFYPIGVEAKVEEINPQGYVVVKTGERVDINQVALNEEKEIFVDTTVRPDIDDLDQDEAHMKLQKIKSDLKELAGRFQGGSFIQSYIDQYTSIEEAASVLSAWLTITNEERYDVLKEDSKKARFEKIEKIIYEYTEVTKVATDAKASQQEDYQKLYREQALKKQIDYLQKELDEMHPEQVSDVRKFELKIQESGMNEDARKEATKVVNRLKNDNGNSGETGMLYDYLDFVTSLSWKKEKARKINLDEAEKILDADHFGLKKVKERIIQQIAVMNLRKKQSGSILLFVGAPGTGKTSIGRSIAKALHRKYVRVSLGGVRDEADIRGHRRTYIGAMPGRIMDGIQKSGVSNPVMVLDEVDKLSSSYNGDPAAALLEVLDPEQNNTFTDHYMNVPYDLSDVMFICTANTLDTIPEPLLNRMEVIQFQGYTPTEKFEIAKRHLLPKSLEAVGLKPEQLEVKDEAIEKMISDFTREAGVRGLKKRLDTLARIAAVDVTRDPEKKVTVEPEMLRKYLDMPALPHTKVKDEAKPGVVTGLAWTSVGGEILYIESLFTKGNGKLTITGKLGDVMKESVEIALSLVKSMFPDKAKLFDKNDLHIHVPDGSTPKDGPSAGITLTTAIASLVTGNAVSPHIAMTGEVTLEGAVNAIGGLPEKLMAAQRAGVTKVFIPKDNVDDLLDVADEVKKNLEIIPVSSVEEVLEQTGVKEKKPELRAV